MDMQAALRARLIADGAVAALAGTRVYWIERPQAAALPALTLQTISGGRESNYKSDLETQSARVQVDVWDSSYSAVRALAKAVIASIEPAHVANGVRFERSFLENQSDLGEDTASGFVHRLSLDFIIWYAEL